MESYNETWHSGVRSESVNVTKENENVLWWQMYWPKMKYVKEKKKMRKRDPYAFKVDDKVHISAIRKPFQSKYEPKWSAEIFKIQ